jgi:flagellar biosynthesis protein FlhB
MGRFVFIPSNDNTMPFGNGFKGDIYYRFNDTKYETATTKTLEEKIERLCLLIVSKNKYCVGLEYICGELIAPVVVIKTDNVNEMVSLCKKNDVIIVHNKKLTEVLYKDGEIEEIIFVELWTHTAKLFQKLMKNDKNFSMRIKYHE